LSELCTRAGLPSPDSLVQRHLIALCDTIESDTGVLISLSTIKRLFNGQFARLPQVATLNAIALSAGYKNWQDFIQAKASRPPALAQNKHNPGAVFQPLSSSKQGPDANPEQNKQDPDPERYTASLKQTSDRSGQNPKPRPNPRVLIAAAALILIPLATLVILLSHKAGSVHTDKAHFSVTKTTGNDIPNTVIFKYNVDSVQADSFFIQQSWDRNRRVQIFKHNYILTDLYYEPGYHTAKLIADNKIIRTLPVSIPTDRWLFYAIENKQGGRPKYITHPDTGMLKLSTGEIVAGNIDPQKDNVYCTTWFPSNIRYSSDNFTLKCRVRVKPVNNESCPQLMCEIYCQNYFMYFRSTLKGCTGVSTAQFGEIELNGRSNDLSGLAADLREWQDLEFTVRDKKVNIAIGGRQTFTTAYTRSAGLITGLGFISNGISEVQFVNFNTADGKTIYSRGKE
jgi:hypothetical protein